MTSSAPTTPAAAIVDDRPMWPAIRQGWSRRCPQCGKGAMFDGYLKIRSHCPSCNEELHHHRADDGPAYMTIIAVGKVLGPLLYVAFVHWRPDPVTMSVVFSLGAILMSLYLLPRMKGSLIGIQWSRRMHGFGRTGT